MKKAGIILIILQIVSLIPSFIRGENLFANGFANLLGRFIFAILGVILLVVAYNRDSKRK